MNKKIEFWVTRLMTFGQNRYNKEKENFVLTY